MWTCQGVSRWTQAILAHMPVLTCIYLYGNKHPHLSEHLGVSALTHACVSRHLKGHLCMSICGCFPELGPFLQFIIKPNPRELWEAHLPHPPQAWPSTGHCLEVIS